MLRLSMFVLVLSVAGCGQQHQTAPELLPLLELFISAGESRGLDTRNWRERVSIEFRPQPHASWGRCLKGRGAVEIDPTIWARLIESAKEALVFHELGHCLLNRPHWNQLAPPAQPGAAIGRCSMMNASLPPGDAYESLRQEYLDELFFSDGRCVAR
jgi:hypothetical protein